MYVLRVNFLQSPFWPPSRLTAGPDFHAEHGGYPRSFVEGQGMDATLSFGQRNFGNLDLGDVRRTERLVRAADDMCRHPGGTLPDKLNRPADLRAFYRLMNRPEVTHRAVMSGHTQDTRARIAALTSGVVLCLHDATELDYTSKKSLWAQLSQIGQGTHRGYVCQNSLAVHLSRATAQTEAPENVSETLGLVSQILHQRAQVPKGETAKQKRERKNRESRLWVEAAKASGPAPEGVLCVDVSDSLSDTFEYMSFEVTHHRHFLLRARENRRLAQAVAGKRHLFQALGQLPSAGQRDVTVHEAPPHKHGKKHSKGRRGRKTKVEVAFAPVRLAPPGKKSGEYENVPLELWAIRVWERDTPANEDALEWVLLTNCPVHNLADACERIGWYERRWIIEEYHKGMKTGCGIESLQFEKIERLEPTIAVISAVATTLLRLRDAARAANAETRPATEVVDAAYVRVLVGHYRERLKPHPSVKAFFMHVARLGGHQNRKSDGLPGWITLWRGWMKLQAMVDGYRAVRLSNQATCGKT